MVAVDKMQELHAVVNFWQARIGGLSAHLGMLHYLTTQSRSGGDRYTADRLLREIERKSAEIAEAERSLHFAKRDLVAATEIVGHRVHTPPPSSSTSSTENNFRAH